MQKFFSVVLVLVAFSWCNTFAQLENSTPQVFHSINNDLSIPLRDMVNVPISQPFWEGDIRPWREIPLGNHQYKKDPALQETNGSVAGATIIQNFEGVPHDIYAPPDVTCSVGPNNVMMMVNVRYQIWDKAGTSLLGPFNLGTLWSGFPGPWSSSLNDGDPVVLYDQEADRWFASEFSLPNGGNGPEYILIAISQTGDPTGAWYRYGFEFPQFPDYPHYGIWPDGYYMSVNRFAPSFVGTYTAAFERAEMLNGNPAQYVYFTNSTSAGGSFLPSDWDGVTPPPTGAPNYFTSLGTNSLHTYEFHVDWVTPANSTFTGPLTTSVSAFTTINSIQQLGTTTTLDGLSDRLMQRQQYRNFGSHQSMVTCHSIDAGGGRAGVRWYELRNTGAGWTLYQEGTYAPADGQERWMGSIAMNGVGDIALGYSVSSTTIHPEIRFTGRQDGDPLGTMTMAESTIFAGAGSQTGGLSRWGDYTHMSVDPTDDQTFWYANEYIPSNGSFNWNTRIASFIFSAPCSVDAASNPNPADGASGVSASLSQLSWSNGAGANTNETYFGTNPASLPLVQSGTLATSWNITGGPLSYSTTYYWRIVEIGDTCSQTGPLWSFTTEANPSIVIDEVYCDDFEAGAGGWTITNDGGTCVWDISTLARPYTMPATATGNVFAADADLCGSGTTVLSTATLSQTFDLSQYTEMVWVEFDNDWRFLLASDEAHVEASTDGGSTWTGIWDQVGVDVRNTHEVVDATALLVGQSNVMFRLRSVQPGWDWWWAVDNFCIYGEYILPVELTSFAANVVDNKIQLNWATATEINNQGFDIERKSNTGEYQKIGFVGGFGTSTETHTYTYTDNNVTAGSYTYRLKQVDFDGTFEYSNEVNVDIVAPLEFALDQNYPNPFNPSTTIKYSTAQDGLVKLAIYNMLGEEVTTLVNKTQKAGRYEVNFNASNLASGVYIYRLDTPNFTSAKKLMLMK